jgi:hypothetical protein
MYRPTAHSRPMRGQGMTVRCHPVLSRRCLSGKGSFMRRHYWWAVLSSLYLSIEYHIVKRVLTRRCLPTGKVMMLFRHVPQAWRHRWWRDGFPTWVSTARGAWVPTTMPHCDRCLRPTVLETHKGAIFIRIGEPLDMRRLGIPLQVARLGGLVTESRPPTLNCRVVELPRGSSLWLVHFMLVGPSH